ncbi:AzlC family ABC transporter permease [Leptolyngbya sp. PL-A3]|nr:AzlC family ABC transporter permease [Leptolyngbya sp. FACHB-8]MBD1910757.1 AzlC family ABC transporter permease [Leptolyngbya sp. FACHB-8]MBD2158224.1 AzlC family ABC transporter permease [Leptolyngbya sp. FACHB-16]
MRLSRLTPVSEFLAGARDIIPLVVGAIPFGIIFGTLALSSGVSVAGAIALSAVVFAGSSQFIAIGMVAAGTAWPLIVLTTFVVNLRHLLYSMSLVPHVKHLPQHWKLAMGFWLTDEAFAIAIRRYETNQRNPLAHWYYLGAALLMYVNWQVWTCIGIAVGQRIPNAANWGLDFAMSVTFIGMIIPYLKTRPMGLAVTVAGITALLTYSWPHKVGLMLASLVGITVGLWSENALRDKSSSL